MSGRQRLLLLILGVISALAAPQFAAKAHAGQLRAGVATLDATYHVGSSAGQYASTRDGGYGDFDPHFQQGKNQASYGIQSRLTVRALVVQADGGDKVALVKTDLYIAQDMLWRRAAQILEAKGIGIGKDNLTMAVSHNHSSPYYTSTAWGAWAFQDVLDVRNYDYMANRIADAVVEANDSLAPVRVSARTGYMDKLHRHSFGPSEADDKTPAGYPQSDAEHVFTVVRFDRLGGKDGKRPVPLANLLNYSGHPEFLDGNDLISADYLGALERNVDRETGATTIFTQNAVGTAEPERSTFHDFHERLEFDHKEYAQAEFAARMLSDAVVGTWREIGRQRAGSETLVPWTSDAPVAMSDRWFPGPLSHPYPGVSNCRTNQALAGNPGVPVVGLPDCNRDADGRPLFEAAKPVLAETPFGPGLDTGDFEKLGIPLPSNYSAPSYGALQETVGVHLQGFRIGDIFFPICSCEQWKDQSRNIQTRTDKVPGNEWLGYDWSAQCDPVDASKADTDWMCVSPHNPAAGKTKRVGSKEFLRMRAQVRNDASGWNDPEYLPYAEHEPDDPAKIKGNYTHDDTPAKPQSGSYASTYGYALTVPIAMANDYNGYIATYREYQRGDHYRKALTGYGPHSSDYFATRLVRMGQELKGDEAARAELDGEPLSEKEIANQLHADAKATAIGSVAAAGVAAYENALPDEKGDAAVVDQPKDIERFAAAHFRWRGGSNYVDDPSVRVQRRVGKAWRDFGDMSGEVVATVKYPTQAEGFDYLSGSYSWLWTATWEAYSSDVPATAPDGERVTTTPAGTYRFVVEGKRRTGGSTEPYRLVSDTFAVRPWDGITASLSLSDAGVPTVALGPNGSRDGKTLKESHEVPDPKPWDPGAKKREPIPVSAPVGPIDYPNTYTTPLRPRFVAEEQWVVRDPAAPADASKWEWYCFECTFRPWADFGDAQSVTLTVRGAKGKESSLAMKPAGGGKWVAPRPLVAGERAVVEAGAVRDRFGNVNGSASQTVTR